MAAQSNNPVVDLTDVFKPDTVDAFIRHLELTGSSIWMRTIDQA